MKLLISTLKGKYLKHSYILCIILIIIVSTVLGQVCELSLTLNRFREEY